MQLVSVSTRHVGSPLKEWNALIANARANDLCIQANSGTSTAENNTRAATRGHCPCCLCGTQAEIRVPVRINQDAEIWSLPENSHPCMLQSNRDKRQCFTLQTCSKPIASSEAPDGGEWLPFVAQRLPNVASSKWRNSQIATR